MKIYCFYVPINNNRENEIIITGNKLEIGEVQYKLYAYTDSKSIKDDFIEVRDMNIFKLKIYDMCNKSIKSFNTTYCKFKLDYIKIISSTKSNFIRILSTVNEIDNVRRVIEEDILYNHIINNLCNPLFMALDDKYIKVIRTILSNNADKDKILYDELEVYLSMFRDTFHTNID